MTIISILFIIVSTVTLVVSSVTLTIVDVETTAESPLKYKYSNKSTQIEDWSKINETTYDNELQNISITSTGDNDGNKKKRKVLRRDDQSAGVTETIELICIIWFTAEYVVRLICCPNVKKFLIGFMNIVDLVAIAPFFMCLIMNLVIVNESMSEKLDSIRQMMQLFRVLRVIRILKFARHSVGLQSLGYTLKKSYNELGMLMMFIGLGSFLFSSLVYFVERDMVNTQFTSILAANWWAIISMTTVGYGDMVPESVIGRIIGSLCCVFGVLIISLPIPIIVSNFGEFYQEKSRVENTLRKKVEFEKAMASGCLVFENDNIRSSSFLAEENRKERLEAFLREIETIKFIDDE